MRELVPDLQSMALVVIFTLGNSFIMALGSRAGNDIWLSFLLAIVLAVPVIALYARMRSLMHGESLQEGLATIYGKWPSRAIALAYSFYAWRLGSYVLIDLTSFIESISLPTTPRAAVATAYTLLALWAAKEGVEVLARWSVVMIRGVYFILFVAFAMLVTEVDLAEFLPVLYDGFQPILLGTLQLLDVPFLETVVLFWVFDAFVKPDSPYKVFLPGFAIASVFMCLIASASLAVLGAEQYATNYFPVFVATSRIDVAAFLTRLEYIVSISFGIGGFLKVAVCLLAASKALAIGLGFTDYRFLVTPVALSMIPAAQWLITDMMEAERIATKVVGSSQVFFQFVLPLILWITAEIRVAKGKKNSAST